MAHSIIGVYELHSQAREAMNELLATGFDPHKLHISPDREPAAQATHASSADHHSSGIGHFFRSLFGGESHAERGHVYSEAVRRGNTLLRVDAPTQTECDRAMEIMQRYAPVDIDDRAASWRQDGWSGFDASAPGMTEEEIREDRNRYASRRSIAATTEMHPRQGLHVYPMHEDTVAQQHPAAVNAGPAVRDDGAQTQHVDATFRQEGDSIVDMSHASTTGEQGAEAPAARIEDDADFRHHWQHAYGTSGGRYEEYDAAYRYGSELPGSSRFQSGNWDDAEPAIRRDWEMRHPESTWDRVKDAVRYGAQRPRNGTPR